MHSLIFWFSAEEPGKCHIITVNIVHERQQSEEGLTAYTFIPNIPEDNRLKRPRLQMRRAALFSLCTASRSAPDGRSLQKLTRHWNNCSKLAGLVSLRWSRRISQILLATGRRCLLFITPGVKKTHMHTLKIHTAQKEKAVKEKIPLAVVDFKHSNSVFSCQWRRLRLKNFINVIYVLF